MLASQPGLRTADIFVYATTTNEEALGAARRALANVSLLSLFATTQFKRGKQRGAIQAVRDARVATMVQWDRYDWVLRLNPDVRIVNISRVLALMRNPALEAICVKCSGMRMLHLMTDFTVLRPRHFRRMLLAKSLDDGNEVNAERDLVNQLKSMNVTYRTRAVLRNFNQPGLCRTITEDVAHTNVRSHCPSDPSAWELGREIECRPGHLTRQGCGEMLSGSLARFHASIAGQESPEGRAPQQRGACAAPTGNAFHLWPRSALLAPNTSAAAPLHDISAVPLSEGAGAGIPRTPSLGPSRVAPSVGTKMLQHSLLLVTLSSPRTRWQLGRGMQVAVQDVPVGTNARNLSWFAGGNPCCISDDDTTCQHLVPCCVSVIGDGHRTQRDVLVARCRAAVETDACASLSLTPQRPHRGEFSTAVCVPVFFGTMLDVATSSVFASYVAHYRRIGAERLYIYSESAAPDWVAGELATLQPAEMLEVVWVHLDFHSEQRRPGQKWSLGQNWAANDCHKRSLAAGFAWVLSVDFDERLAFAAPEHATIEAYLRSLGRPVDVVDFGSSVEHCPKARDCTTTPPPPKMSQVTCAKWRNTSVLPHTCSWSPVVNANRSRSCCLGSRGHRKHLTSTSSGLDLNIHTVSAPPWSLHHESTDVAWLRHFQGWQQMGVAANGTSTAAADHEQPHSTSSSSLSARVQMRQRLCARPEVRAALSPASVPVLWSRELVRSQKMFMNEKPFAASKFQPFIEQLPRNSLMSSAWPDGCEMCDTCAVVGASGSLRKFEHGAQIDGHSLVLRPNWIITEGYEGKVGTRTSINLFFGVEEMMEQFEKHQRSMPEERRAIGLITSNSDRSVASFFRYMYRVRKSTVLNKTATAAETLVTPSRVFLTTDAIYHKALAEICRATGEGRMWQRTSGTMRPSTGFISVIIALQICRNVSLFGLTDDPCQPFHYYGEPKANCTKAIPTQNDEPLHWFEKEHEIYARWHREGRLTVYS